MYSTLTVGALAAVYLLAALATGTVCVLAWRRRRATPAAPALSLVMAAIAGWCLCDLLVLGARADLLPTRVGRIAFAPIFPLAALLVAAFWAMSRAIADRDWRPRRRVLAALAVHPLAITVSVAVGQGSGAVYQDIAQVSGTWTTWHPGWLFWVHLVVSYTMLTWTYLTLVRVWRHGSPLQRSQTTILLAAGLIPIPANLLVVLSPPGSLPELTAIAFAITGLIDGYALLRLGLMRLIPVARGLILERLRDAVVVLDTDGRLIDANQAGDRLLRDLDPGLPGTLAGVPALEILSRSTPGTPLLDGERTVDLPSGSAVLDLRIEPLEDVHGRPLGRVIVVRDVTELDRLRAHLAELAVRDELTGLHNRRYLMAVLERELAAALRAGADLCAILLDLDHFKTVNDQYGHAVGDALLVATSSALAGVLRSGDTLARYGGEEFVALLPGATAQQAYARAQELRERCANVAVSAPSGPVRRTVSIGVASAQQVAAHDGGAALTPAMLLQAADDALYRAKLAGRDRVVAG